MTLVRADGSEFERWNGHFIDHTPHPNRQFSQKHETGVRHVLMERNVVIRKTG